MVQIFDNIWNLVTSIFNFIVISFSSLANGVIFCYRIFGQGLIYLTSFGPTALYLISVIMILLVIWLVLRIVHG